MELVVASTIGILTAGGVYLIRTPHAFTGPHDVSKYFCDEPEGFKGKLRPYQKFGTRCRRRWF